MLLRAFFVMVLAMGLTGVATANLSDPMPHCWPCDPDPGGLAVK